MSNAPLRSVISKQVKTVHITSLGDEPAVKKLILANDALAAQLSDGSKSRSERTQSLQDFISNFDPTSEDSDFSSLCPSEQESSLINHSSNNGSPKFNKLQPSSVLLSNPTTLRGSTTQVYNNEHSLHPAIIVAPVSEPSFSTQQLDTSPSISISLQPAPVSPPASEISSCDSTSNSNGAGLSRATNIYSLSSTSNPPEPMPNAPLPSPSEIIAPVPPSTEPVVSSTPAPTDQSIDSHTADAEDIRPDLPQSVRDGVIQRIVNELAAQVPHSTSTTPDIEREIIFNLAKQAEQFVFQKAHTRLEYYKLIARGISELKPKMACLQIPRPVDHSLVADNRVLNGDSLTTTTLSSTTTASPTSTTATSISSSLSSPPPPSQPIIKSEPSVESVVELEVIDGSAVHPLAHSPIDISPSANSGASVCPVVVRPSVSTAGSSSTSLPQPTNQMRNISSLAPNQLIVMRGVTVTSGAPTNSLLQDVDPSLRHTQDSALSSSLAQPIAASTSFPVVPPVFTITPGPTSLTVVPLTFTVSSGSTSIPVIPSSITFLPESPAKIPTPSKLYSSVGTPLKAETGAASSTLVSVSKLPKVPKVFIPQELQRAFMPVWERIYRLEPESLPFREPVDPNLREYFNLVKKPMDLSSIRARLFGHMLPAVGINGRERLAEPYFDPWDIVRDFYQIFTNAWIYNKRGSRIYKYANKLHEVFESEVDFAMQKLGFCCGHIYLFQPAPLVCFGPSVGADQKSAGRGAPFAAAEANAPPSICTIARDSFFYSYEGHYTFCERCFNSIKDDFVRIADDPSQQPTYVAFVFVLNEPLIK